MLPAACNVRFEAIAMVTGEESTPPARDKGRARRFVRDHSDARALPFSDEPAVMMVSIIPHHGAVDASNKIPLQPGLCHGIVCPHVYGSFIITKVIEGSSSCGARSKRLLQHAHPGARLFLWYCFIAAFPA